MNLDALLHVFYLDVYEFEVYDLFSRPQTRILRGIAVLDLAYPKLVETHCSLIFSKVGVDPLLRTSIWKHLVDICDPNLSTRSTTIVITTHYIEEARAASRVGMMRSGKLLAEGAPDDLIAKYQRPTLEEIFLGKKKKS